jgi:hypothetical protein
MRLGHGGRHARQTGAMRSEKCVARHSRAWDGMRVIAVCFTRALQRCAGRTNRRFLLILQEVRAIGKTRNQFIQYQRVQFSRWCGNQSVQLIPWSTATVTARGLSLLLERRGLNQPQTGRESGSRSLQPRVVMSARRGGSSHSPDVR